MCLNFIDILLIVNYTIKLNKNSFAKCALFIDLFVNYFLNYY